MNKKPSIKIINGDSLWYKCNLPWSCDCKPRITKINYELPFLKYAMVHIKVRNDESWPYTRVILVYYGSTIECFKEYNDLIWSLSSKKMDRLINLKKVWVWEWKRKGNGDLYKIYKVEDLETENIKKMLSRIEHKISVCQEDKFLLSDDEIYKLYEDVDIPNFLKINHHDNKETLDQKYESYFIDPTNLNNY